ncbi:DUF1090 domain-containing protein [Shewanella sp. OMA3-2]|uniref:DUF1090 domain-containing protein n=1 Tax=Shewanella sp. OMA3-2 TaxID=2908650 RepID=UPI001F354146|nr:DUF1090 domain-containing protein [Shewanella sp. OMA3-2]UJF21190.1 DUF1090 domain-containing protein [Shewanella sp. OMA3-2]
MSRYRNIFLLATVLGYASISNIADASSLNCDSYIGCERKFCEIEKQISIAKGNNNQTKLAGLNIALTESRAHCSNKSIIEDLISEADEIKQDILEYEQDLKEAQASQKTDKILKYTNKIAEKNVKLQDVETKLSVMQKKG